MRRVGDDGAPVQIHLLDCDIAALLCWPFIHSIPALSTVCRFSPVGDAFKFSNIRILFLLVLDSDDVHVVSVTAGWSHSASLTNNGVIHTWGCNIHGQLGYDTQDMGHSGTPKIVEFKKETPNAFQSKQHSPSPSLSSSAATAEDFVLNVSLGSYHSAAINSEVREDLV